VAIFFKEDGLRYIFAQNISKAPETNCSSNLSVSETRT